MDFLFPGARWEGFQGQLPSGCRSSRTPSAAGGGCSGPGAPRGGAPGGVLLAPRGQVGSGPGPGPGHSSEAPLQSGTGGESKPLPGWTQLPAAFPTRDPEVQTQRHSAPLDSGQQASRDAAGRARAAVQTGGTRAPPFGGPGGTRAPAWPDSLALRPPPQIRPQWGGRRPGPLELARHPVSSTRSTGQPLTVQRRPCGPGPRVTGPRR